MESIFTEKYRNKYNRDKITINTNPNISTYEILRILSLINCDCHEKIPVKLPNKYCNQLCPEQILPPFTLSFLCKLSTDRLFIKNCARIFLRYLSKGNVRNTIKYSKNAQEVFINKYYVPIYNWN